YFFDSGVYRAIRPMSQFDRPEAIAGISLETLFFQNLRAVNDYLKLGYRLYYYRTVAGVEVDFIAYGPKGLVAFEVKSKRNIFKKDLTGLKTFLGDYPMAKGIMVYGGDHKMYDRGIEIWPAAEALKSLPEILSK
ncbi:MAG: DUF4143 domain-containing protein, partial [bacterium]|nr:DUF4143 domain-containing protein [bacterium]